ncbi:hypothetical protein C8J57DRAFT_1381159, partial [Mycena rebaudengoi]
NPPRWNYFLWMLLVLALFVLFAGWIKILGRTPKISPFFRTLSRLWAHSARCMIACVEFINWVIKNITWARVVNAPTAIYLAISSFRGLHTNIYFNLTSHSNALPSSITSLPLLWATTLRHLLDQFDQYRAAGIRATELWLVNVPWPQIARAIAIFALSVLAYRIVLYVTRALTRWLNRRTARLAPGPDFGYEFCKFGLIIWFPIWAVARTLRFVEEVIYLRLYDNHVWVVHVVQTVFEALTKAFTFIGSSVSLLLAFFSPFEKLIVFGPASALAALLLLHVPLWQLKYLFRLYLKRRYAVAASVAVNFVTLGISFLESIDFPYVAHATIEYQARVWDPLPLGYKIVLAPMLFGLLGRLKLKARGRRRLGR